MLGNAVPAYQGVEALIDGLTYSYAVESGGDFECGQGVYVEAVQQLLRSPTKSSANGAPVPFPANVSVNFTALAADLASRAEGTGTVTSVSGSGGSTGLTLTGGPIVQDGTLTLGGTLVPAHGGTGGTDAPSARTALGLGNVNNTSDANKPISTATQAALDEKADTADLVATFRQIGADPTGGTSCSTVLAAALGVYDRIEGTPGDTYLIGSQVSVPEGKQIVGNGASLRIGAGVVGLHLTGDKSEVSDWAVDGNGGLYAVRDSGRFNRFEKMICTGNIGHFYFGTASDFATVSDVVIDGNSASGEITTAIVLEDCTNAKVKGISSNNLPVGWTIQIRGGENINVSQVNTEQEMFTDEATSTASQTIFVFNIGSVCAFKKVQIDGKPLSQVGGNYTISGAGPTYTVTFAVGRPEGENIKLVGFRGAENIQINNGAKKVNISDFALNGTGDGGLLVLGSEVNLNNGLISNAGYSGLALYGGTDIINVNNLVIENCAQLDDGLASPDNPAFPSVFAGGIFTSGENINLDNIHFLNSSGTMRYGLRLNKTDPTLLYSDGSRSINIGKMTWGLTDEYVDGKIFAPNETTGQRINSVGIDAPSFPYAEQIDIDQEWELVPYDETPSPYFAISGFNSHLIRDTSIKMGGVASIKTAANSWGQIELTGGGMFYDCVLNVTFWAINASGSSYVEVRTDLGGLIHGMRADIVETEWRKYTISLLLSANLERYVSVRFGGVTGSANIQHVYISGQKL